MPDPCCVRIIHYKCLKRLIICLVFLTNLKKNYQGLIENHGRELQSTNQPDIYVSTTLNTNAISSPVTTTTTGTDTTVITTTSFDISTSGIAPKTLLPTTQKSGGCYKILAKKNIETILEKNVIQGNHTGNSTAGNYTITFRNPEKKKVDDIDYTIIKFCVSWNSFADVTEIDLGKVQNHVKKLFIRTDYFIGSMVPSNWDMWRFSSEHEPAWYKIYNQSKEYYWEASNQCKRNNGLLAYYTIRKSNQIQWEQLLKNYTSDMIFWTGLRYYVNTTSRRIIGNGGSSTIDLLLWQYNWNEGNTHEKFINIDQNAMLGTTSNGTMNYFICEAVSIRSYRFQILSSEKRSDEELLQSLVDSFNIDVTISDAQQIESGWDGIWIVKFQTKVARKHLESRVHWDYLQREFNGNTKFIGKPVSTAWKLWRNRSFPMWYNVYNHSGVGLYNSDKGLCTRKGGDLPDARWMIYDWTKIIEKYTDGVRFWTSNVSHVTLFPNGTRSNEDASHFLCTSAPLSQYCFQVVTNATIAKNILQYLKVGKSFFSEEQYEEFEFYGAYNIFKYRIYTVDTEDHFWENINKFSDDYLQGKVLGSPVPCDWDLWEGEAFAWYKKFNDNFTYNEAEQTCGKYNGQLANIITRDSGDEWKRKLWSGHDYWIAATSSQRCQYVYCYQGFGCFNQTTILCDESKSFVCESELPTVRLPMKIVVKSYNENTSFFAENLWKIWRNHHYIFRIDALIGSTTAFETVGDYKIFKFNVVAPEDDNNAVFLKLATAFKNSGEADGAVFQTNPAPEDWSLWTKLPSAPVWYKIISDKKNYTDARMKCEEFGARLAAKTIRVTEDELQHWNVEINRDGYWIGLEARNEYFEWSDGAAYDYDNTPWAQNQPDNHNGGESCTEMWYMMVRRSLNDAHCNRKMKFICESD